MEDGKNTTLAFVISVFIHILIFSMPVFSKAIFPETYKLTEIVPLTFDTEVESKLIGERSVKGSDEKVFSLKKNFIPRGKSSSQSKDIKKIPPFSSPHSTHPDSLNSKLFSSAGVTINNRFIEVKKNTGNGQLSLFFSGNVEKNGKNEKLPAIKRNKIVPYLLQIRNKILSHWKLPYTKLTGKEKTTIYITIERNGKVREINVGELSSNVPFNRSAITAIYDAEPFPPFPKGMKGISEVKVKVNFESK